MVYVSGTQLLEEKISNMKLYCGQKDGGAYLETEAGEFSEFKASLIYKARPMRLSQKKREALLHHLCHGYLFQTLGS